MKGRALALSVVLSANMLAQRSTVELRLVDDNGQPMSNGRVAILALNRYATIENGAATVSPDEVLEAYDALMAG